MATESGQVARSGAVRILGDNRRRDQKYRRFYAIALTGLCDREVTTNGWQMYKMTCANSRLHRTQ